ncbi:MAG: hypothetical protein EPO02_13575 [Nitrospirae bacterium]|nr:MAG: hypothetical protein EPO02_13575 [Nitrospirota bacterium]
MQSVNAAFTAEEKDFTRRIVENLLISWHRQNVLGNKTFTIGVSTIGGNDIIGITAGAVGSPSNYKYFDESAYAMSLGWERGYNMPTGGLTMALAEAVLDNSSGRFTPRYMGGNSEISTAILPSRPAIINAGFNIGGVNISIPQFAGLISDQPEVGVRDRSVNLKLMDYVSYFKDKKLDTAVMFTGQRTDQVLTTLSSLMGMNTAQYDYDTGVNLIPFGYFPVGTNFADAFGQLVEAEGGHYYQDESGTFKFENRYHWNSAPYTNVQMVINTSQVIDAKSPDLSHLINLVEITSNIRTKQTDQLLFTLASPLTLAPNTTTDLFVNFNDPILALDTPAYWVANSISDGTGTDLTSSVTLKSYSAFAQAAKLTFNNSSSSTAYITSLTLYGRPALVSTNLYYRAKDDSSVTAYDTQILTLNNDFIGSQIWAQTLSQMILNDFSDPSNIQQITIKAMPQLQLGDLISWQGRYWRIFDYKTTLDPSVGFTQDLLLLQKTITSYFRIGISTIGGSDKISP